MRISSREHTSCSASGAASSTNVIDSSVTDFFLEGFNLKDSISLSACSSACTRPSSMTRGVSKLTIDFFFFDLMVTLSGKIQLY